MADDPLAAALADMKERVAERDKLIERMKTGTVGIAEFNAAQDRLAGFAPQALAAVEAALKLADKYDAESERLWARVRDADRQGVMTGTASIDAAWNGDAAKAIREVVARELTGTEADHAAG